MKAKGLLAESRFQTLAIELGYTVSLTFGDNAEYDMVIDNGSGLKRVQVKSTSILVDEGRVYRCLIARGKNNKERYSEDAYDLLAVHVTPEKAWYLIPKEDLKTMNLKLYPHRKPRYSRYEKYRIA